MSTHPSDGLSEIYRNLTGLDQGDPLDTQTPPEPEAPAPEPYEEAAQNGPLDVYEQPKNAAVADGPSDPDDEADAESEDEAASDDSDSKSETQED